MVVVAAEVVAAAHDPLTTAGASARRRRGYHYFSQIHEEVHIDFGDMVKTHVGWGNVADREARGS
jgi:hypothetical protein